MLKPNNVKKLADLDLKKVIKSLKLTHKNLLKTHRRMYEGDYSLNKDSEDYKANVEKINELKKR